jgi:hypothetical protein
MKCELTQKPHTLCTFCAGAAALLKKHNEDSYWELFPPNEEPQEQDELMQRTKERQDEAAKKYAKSWYLAASKLRAPTDQRLEAFNNTRKRKAPGDDKLQGFADEELKAAEDWGEQIDNDIDGEDESSDEEYDPRDREYEYGVQEDEDNYVHAKEQTAIMVHSHRRSCF